MSKQNSARIAGKGESRRRTPGATQNHTSKSSTPALKFITSAASEDESCHHLRREANGHWQLCLTVDRGPKIGCLPVVVGLDTCSEQRARELRDLVMAALEKARRVAAAVG